MRKKPQIAVIGSFAIDHIMQISHLPQAGETVGEGRYSRAFGGKGANQALAAQRSGSQVSFVGCVGRDSTGDQAIQAFQQQGIDTQFLLQHSDENTGSAMIFVDQAGENSIAVAPGANFQLLPDHIDGAKECISSSSLILMQLEIPLQTVFYTLEKAKQWQIPVLLNPAPARQLSDAVLQQVEILVVNETEAEILSGMKITDEVSLSDISNYLSKKGPAIVIITLGSGGAFVHSDDLKKLIPAFKVAAVDTTAAGDVFCGALATALMQQQALQQAVSFANAAAALSVTRPGAQPSVPDMQEINTFLNNRI